jgi:hypothetical protein
MILSYGPNTNDLSFTSKNASGSVNLTLSFNFPFQNSAYSTIQLNVNGYLTMNNSIWLAAYANNFVTNGSGSGVYYREINGPSSDLNVITAKILDAYTNATFFNATNAFVITWYNVQLVNTSQLNAFQMILATDNVYSFVLYYYSRVDSASQMTCISFNPAVSAGYSSVITSPNCTVNNSLVELVNTAGLNFSAIFKTL